MEERENILGLLPFIDLDKTPYNSNGFLELRGRGWDLLSQQLRQSNGCALVLSHPVWHPEVDSITEQREIIQKLRDKKQKENLEQYVYRFETYARNMLKTVTAALDQKLPVIMLLEVEDDERDWRTRTDQKVKDAVARARDSLTSYGYHEKGEIFFVPTVKSGQIVLTDNPNYTTSIRKQRKEIRDAQEAFYSHLKQSGLSFAVVGGVCFGGEERYERRFSRFFVKPGRHNVVARVFKNERELNGLENPNTLELIKPLGCVAGVIEDLASSEIRFRIGRGVTYPQLIPLVSELKRKGREYEWTRGRDL